MCHSNDPRVKQGVESNQFVGALGGVPAGGRGSVHPTSAERRAGKECRSRCTPLLYRRNRRSSPTCSSQPSDVSPLVVGSHSYLARQSAHCLMSAGAVTSPIINYPFFF